MPAPGWRHSAAADSVSTGGQLAACRLGRRQPALASLAGIALAGLATAIKCPKLFHGAHDPAMLLARHGCYRKSAGHSNHRRCGEGWFSSSRAPEGPLHRPKKGQGASSQGRWPSHGGVQGANYAPCALRCRCAMQGANPACLFGANRCHCQGKPAAGTLLGIQPAGPAACTTAPDWHHLASPAPLPRCNSQHPIQPTTARSAQLVNSGWSTNASCASWPALPHQTGMHADSAC